MSVKYRPAVNCKYLVGLRRSLVDSLPGTGTPIHDVVDINPGLRNFSSLQPGLTLLLMLNAINSFIPSGTSRWKWFPESFLGQSWYKPYDVAISGGTPALAAYKVQHLCGRQRYFRPTLVDGICHLRQEPEPLLSKIRQILLEFDGKSQLPRYCNLCLGSIWSSDDKFLEMNKWYHVLIMENFSIFLHLFHLFEPEFIYYQPTLKKRAC